MLAIGNTFQFSCMSMYVSVVQLHAKSVGACYCLLKANYVVQTYTLIHGIPCIVLTIDILHFFN